MSYKSTF